MGFGYWLSYLKHIVGEAGCRVAGRRRPLLEADRVWLLLLLLVGMAVVLRLLLAVIMEWLVRCKE